LLQRIGAYEAPAAPIAMTASRSAGTRRVIVAALAAMLALSGAMTFAPSEAQASSSRLKAVIIVGPTGSLTSQNLTDGEAMARSAEAQGMDVRRVFHPKATWERVLANIQGASLVVYMGHGNGWPSPYGSFQEKTKNGFGLNPYDGGSAANHTYYGGNPIRNNIKLAPNAVVILVHLCYASGNAEPGMAIPSADIARQRVDNFAAAFLAVGARAVFSFGWNQRLDYIKALNTTDKTMDELFMTPATSGINGFVGWRNKRFASVRTPGAQNHLDPHTSHGYYRALSGDLSMTASEWRGGSALAAPSAPPVITSLEAAGPTSTTGLMATSTSGAVFHPNGDGLADALLVRHTVDRATYLDVKVRNSAGNTVRNYTVWSEKGSSTSTWNGKRDDGKFAPDGPYTLTYVPRDKTGNVGTAASTQALVLTAAAVAAPSKVAFFARDNDGLAKTTTLKVTLNQRARLHWTIVNSTGEVVRTVRDGSAVDPSVLSFAWNGRDDAGDWVPDGFYRSVVRVATDLGEYAHERTVYAGAFRLTASVANPARGSSVKFVVRSTEALGARPKLRISQPGLAPYTVTMNHVSGRKYRVTVTLKSGGTAGTMELLVSGKDKNGQLQDTLHSLPIR
jgi:flagellar hook assembly protein FlgD